MAFNREEHSTNSCSSYSHLILIMREYLYVYTKSSSSCKDEISRKLNLLGLDDTDVPYSNCGTLVLQEIHGSRKRVSDRPTSACEY